MQAYEIQDRALKASAEYFNGTVVPWLKGESQERRQLLQRLEQKRKECEKRRAEVNLADLDKQIARINREKANIQVENAKQLLAVCKTRHQKAQLHVQQAVLQQRVGRLAKLEAGKMQEARKQEERAAEKLHKAAEGRIKMACAGLEAARARRDAAKVRDLESRRIRGFLALPPLSMPEPEKDTLQAARIRHADQLEQALAAYRELLRHLRLSGIPRADWPALQWKKAERKWSVVLGDLKEKLENTWHKPDAARPKTGVQLFQHQFTAAEIDRLLNRGVSLVFRPNAGIQTARGRGDGR